MKNFKGLRTTRALILIAILVICACAAVPVSAHAQFVRSVPEANAILTRAPVQVEIFFSEALEPGLSSVSVLDANAQVVDQRDAKVDPNNPTHMTISLLPLADGIFTVTWKAVSTTDGHMTSGSFPFAVGNVKTGSLTAVSAQQGPVPISPSSVAIKWLLVVVLAALAGGLPFQKLIWLPSLTTGSPDDWTREGPPAWKGMVSFSLISLFAILTLDLLVQSSLIAGTGNILSYFSTIGRILLDTRLGLIWLVRLTLALISSWMAFSLPRPWKHWVLFGCALLLLFSLSLTSHSAGEPQPFLPLLADWLHLAAISLWIGGLFYFVPAVRHIRQTNGIEQTHLTSLLIIHFSAMALICVGLIGLTGIYTAVLHIGSIPALFNTLYGKALILKLGLASPLLLLGAANLLVLSPRLKKDRLQGIANAPLVRRFSRVILAEVVIGVLVLLSASLLSALPPAVAAATTTSLQNDLHVNDLYETLDISPGRVGQNSFTLQLVSDGQPVTSVTEVLIRFTSTQHNLPPTETRLVSQGKGVYLSIGSYLSLSGTWQVQTIVRRENKFDSYANLDLNIQKPSSGSLLSDNPNLAGAVLILIGLGFSILFSTLSHTPGLRMGWSPVPGPLLMVLGIFFLTLAPPITPDMANPIAPSQTSINAGRALYASHCAACHGESGRGDGPVGITMNPRPADLTKHVNMHSDGQLYTWISQGIPKTKMPGFETKISSYDRWNVVNFIRTYAPQ